MMKTWKLVSMLLLAFVAGACDDEPAGEIDGGVGSAEQADVVWGYEAKTVLKNAGEVRVPLKLSRAVNSAVKITVEAEKRDVNTIAREGIDFNIPEKVVTIPAGDTIAFLKLDLLDDGKATIDREIKLRMTGVYGGGKVGALSSASLYIVNNAFVEFEKAKWETWESADVETSSEVVRNSRFVPLVITGELTEAATIVLEVTDRSAIEPTHFTVEKEFRVSPGQTRIEVEVKPVDDNEINDDRIFILKIKEIRGGNLVLGKATPECEVKILSEEIQRNLFWEKTELNIEDKEAVLDIPVVLDKVPLATFTVDVVADAAGTDAVEGVDYEILTPQVSIDASRRATVQVKVLDNREINADRTLVLKFANITDNTIFVNDEAKSFTLAIQNSDFPAFEGETLNAIEDELNQIRVSIPAVDRDRQIVLEYLTTEAVSGTYFETPQEIITIPAGANLVQIPLNVKYTVDFPTVAPEFTMSIVKVGDFVLENAVSTKLVLTPCDYRKLLGDWEFKIGSYDANGKQYTNYVQNMTFEMKEWKKSFNVKTIFIEGWGEKNVVVNWDAQTGNASWSNDVPLYSNLGFSGVNVDVYLRTAYQNDAYWTPFKYAIPLIWQPETKTFVWEISAQFGLRSDMRITGTSTDANEKILWFIFKDLSMTKK